MRHAIIAHDLTATNAALLEAGPDWVLLTPVDALRVLQEGDVALGRLDVLPSLDGVQEGLGPLAELEARGVHVLNAPSVLLGCHDKLLTARRLARAGLPHPRTHLIAPDRAEAARATSPVVVKPRFGSWGRGVTRHRDQVELRAHLESIRHEPWYCRQGALVQELVPPSGYDIRIVVAGSRVVGAVTRVCAEGEWRTNVALGARRLPVTVPIDAAILALAAAREIGAALVGIDLLPSEDGWTILELNAAVEFTNDYAPDFDVYARTLHELASLARSSLDSSATAKLEAVS